MPPAGKLGDRDITALTEWVRLGAPWPEDSSESPATTSADEAKAQDGHWAWQPLVKPVPPTVEFGDWPLDSIDRFVLANLESRGLAPV